MGITEGRWEGMTSFPDLTLFVGADEIRSTTGSPTLTLNASGDLSLNMTAATYVHVVSEACLLRSGVLATTAFDQEQFGTAASQPGPSSVSNTGSPFGFKPGFPPLTAAQLATLGNVQRGAIIKGIQINSVAPIYSVSGSALTSIALGVTTTSFANGTAFTVANLLAKAQNGLSLATTTAANTPYSTAVAIPTPAMIPGNVLGVESLIELDMVVAGTARLYGFSVNCSFNFN
jgi:hypothetical protein